MLQIVVSDAEVLRRTISAKARASAARAEKYRFKSRSAPPGGGVEELLSVELKSLAASKYEALDSESSQWTDRMYSSLAAPMGSEIYLQAEQSAFLLGAPRFYHNELSTPHVDAQGRSIPPAHARFAYSDEAQMAAKKLQSKLARNYLRRQHAASVLQRVYLNFVCRKRARDARRARHEAAAKIQRFCKQRQERTRRRQLVAEMKNSCCIRIQNIFRSALAKRRVRRRREKRTYKAARVIQRFIAWIPREVRRKRGRARRLHIHAARIQSLFRGGACRQRLKSSLLFWRLSLSGPFTAKMLRTLVPEYRRRGGAVKDPTGLVLPAPEGEVEGGGLGQGDKDDDAVSVNSSVTAASLGSKSVVVSVSAASAAANSAASAASAVSRGSVASTALTVGKFYVASTMRLTRRAYFRYLVHIFWHKRLISLPKESEWEAKCFLFGGRIMRLLRLRVLRKKVARMQRLARKFLARRKFARKFLELAAYERSRVTSEQLLIERALTREAANVDCRWALGLGDRHAQRERLPPNGLLSDEEEEAQTLMIALNLAAVSLLSARGSGDVRAVSLDATTNLAQLPRKQSQSLAVLSAFANRPLGRIDGNAVSVLRPFLRPTEKCLGMALTAAASDLAKKAKARDRAGDRAKSKGPRATSASSVHLDRPLTLPDEQEEVAWSWLEHVPLCGILPLSSLLEPRSSLALRMAVTSRLPDQVLAAAALTRLWTRWTDDVIKTTIRRHRRQRGNKPKYCCPHCLESFALPRDEGQHLRSRANCDNNNSSRSPALEEEREDAEEEEEAGGAGAGGGRVYGKRKMQCVRGRHMSWVGGRAFLAPLKLLHLRVLNILSSSSAYPALSRHFDLGAMMQGQTPLAKEQGKAMLAEARLILSRRHHRALARVEQRLSSSVEGIRFLPLVEDRRMAFCLEDELNLPHASDDNYDGDERSKSKGSATTSVKPTTTTSTSSAIKTDAAVAPDPEPAPKAGMEISVPKSRNKFLDPSTGGDVRRPPGPPPPGK